MCVSVWFYNWYSVFLLRLLLYTDEKIVSAFINGFWRIDCYSMEFWFIQYCGDFRNSVIFFQMKSRWNDWRLTRVEILMTQWCSLLNVFFFFFCVMCCLLFICWFSPCSFIILFWGLFCFVLCVSWFCLFVNMTANFTWNWSLFCVCSSVSMPFFIWTIILAYIEDLFTATPKSHIQPPIRLQLLLLLATSLDPGTNNFQKKNNH